VCQSRKWNESFKVHTRGQKEEYKLGALLRCNLAAPSFASCLVGGGSDVCVEVEVLRELPKVRAMDFSKSSVVPMTPSSSTTATTSAVEATGNPGRNLIVNYLPPSFRDLDLMVLYNDFLMFLLTFC
jgi:hypothetical protein